MGKPRSNKRYEVLGALRIFIETRKRSPSLRELGDACGIAGKASVLHYLNQLQEEGLIERGRKARSITLRGPASFMRLPTQGKPKKTKAEKASVKGGKVHHSKEHYAKCLEKAVKLGLARDAEIAERRDGVFHDNKRLFRNGSLSACKVG
jgi:SOS-response transcriptional repressor LexA